MSNNSSAAMASTAAQTEQTQANVDPAELEKFSALAAQWWDREGQMGPLHEINPLRLGYIDRHANLPGKRLLDVGCGGGILAEAAAKAGAEVTGIDLAQASLQVAKLHALETGTSVDYQEITAEALAESAAGSFDIVSCLEMLEHVPDPASVVEACAKLAKPGAAIFFSTINRNPKSYLFSVIGAEYVLKLLPKGTHDYARFIKPSELAQWARAAGLEVLDMTGLHYNPIFKQYKLSDGVDVNYLMYCRKPA